MRKLPKPNENPEDIFKICISKVRNADLKRRLESCEEDIIQATEDYEMKVANSELHLLPIVYDIGGKVSADEMRKVYTFRMAKKKVPGRPFYDKLLAIPNHGRCPLCGHRTVSTIDHHLPKAVYPIYSVVPINLIPACKDCNITKEAFIPRNSSEETIHPYFDNIESDIWLKARVIESSPCVIEFYVEKPDAWEDLLGRRVEHHFRTLNLSSLYSSQSAEELLNINFLLNNLFRQGGKNAVKAFLKDNSESRLRVFLNSWQSAMYSAISESEWFCSGGFKI